MIVPPRPPGLHPLHPSTAAALGAAIKATPPRVPPQMPIGGMPQLSPLPGVPAPGQMPPTAGFGPAPLDRSALVQHFREQLQGLRDQQLRLEPPPRRVRRGRKIKGE